MLDNPEADQALARIAIERAVAAGVPDAEAAYSTPETGPCGDAAVAWPEPNAEQEANTREDLLRATYPNLTSEEIEHILQTTQWR